MAYMVVDPILFSRNLVIGAAYLIVIGGCVEEKSLYNFALFAMLSHPGGIFGPLAQLVEQLTFNQLVERSNRSRPTN